MDHGSRLLIYSHDSFGLGHLRRCRAIAHHLVERFKHLSVLILSGSPIIGSFDFRSRVDFVRVPGVIKLRNGDYTSLNLHLDIEKTLEIRRSIIHHTAEVFEPGRVPGRQGALGPARRGALDPGDAEGARHPLHPGPARRDGRACEPRRRVAAQDGVPGAGARSTTRSGSTACRRSSTRCARFRAWRRWPTRSGSRAICKRTVPEHAGPHAGAPSAERDVHPGDARRRRRRGGAGRLGDQRLRARSRPAASRRPADGAVHAGRAAAGLPGAGGARSAAARRSPSRHGSSRSSSAPAPWSPWAATTRSARSSRSASRPCWCRAPRPGSSSICAPSGRSGWAWCGCSPMTACAAPQRMAAALRALPAHAGAGGERARADAAGAGADQQPRRALARAARRAARSAPQPLRVDCLGPPRRHPGQGLSAPVGDLHRPGDPGPGAARASTSRSSPCAIRPTGGCTRCTRQIRAPVRYLPEYLYQEPLRVLRALWRRSAGERRFWRLLRIWLGDLAPRPHRQPRPPARPGAGAGGRAAGRTSTGCTCTTCTPRPRSPATPPSCATCPSASRRTPRTSGPSRTGRSARSSPRARWLVTCSRMNLDHLRALAPQADLELVYHGLEAARFPAPARAARWRRQRSRTAGARSSASRARWRRRASTCCSRRWRGCPRDLHWRFEHVGGGAARERAEGAGRAAGHRRAGRPGAAPARRTRCWRPCAAPTCSASPPGSPRTATATACPT